MSKKKKLTLKDAVEALWDLYDAGTPITPAHIQSVIPGLIPPSGQLYTKITIMDAGHLLVLEKDPFVSGGLHLGVLKISNGDDILSVAVHNPNYMSTPSKS